MHRHMHVPYAHRDGNLRITGWVYLPILQKGES